MNKTEKRLLPLLFVGVLMGALDISIVGPAIPSIQESIHVESKLIGWIFSIYVLFNLVGISLFAKLSDLYGRRLIYMVSVTLFAIGSLVVAMSSSFDVLLIGRAVQGFGASGIFPVASAVIGDVFPPERRGRILGFIGMVFGIAFIIGPIFAGIMLSFFSWNALFLINLPIAAFLLYGSYKVMPSKRIGKLTGFDWKGVLLLGSILSAFAYGINQIETVSLSQVFASILSSPFIWAALILLPFFIILETRASNPVVKVSIFLKRQVRLASLIAVATGFMQASFVFIPNYAVQGFHVNPANASFMLIPLVAAIAVGSPLFGRLIDKIGSRLVIIIGLLLSGAGFFLLQAVECHFYGFYLAGVIIGLGLSVLSGSSLRFIMLNEVSANDRASTQGVVTIFVSIGQMLGGALIGLIVASGVELEGYRNLFILQGAMMMVMVFLALLLKNRSEELRTAVRH